MFNGNLGFDTLWAVYREETRSIVTVGDPSDLSGSQSKYTDGLDTGVTFSGISRFLVETGYGADIIVTGYGNDVIDCGRGADRMTGLGGDDTYGVRDATDVVDEGVAGSGGIDTINATVTVSLVDAAHFKGDIENVRLFHFLDFLDINATGNALANVLTGNAGANMLNGLAGADTMRGMAGNDLYGVHDLGDVVDESIAGSGGIDTVNAVVTISLSDAAHFRGDLENATLFGTANLNVTGNALANVLIGNSAANTLNGLAGADVMRGLAGNDLYGVHDLGDVVDESVAGSGGVDRVNSLVNFSLVAVAGAALGKGTLELVTLLGTANAFAYGNSLANILIGNSGANVLAGGLGNDTLTGGGGHDFFVFNTAPYSTTNVDTITDMNEAGNDTIELKNAIFTELAAGTLAAGAFQTSMTGATEADDRIIYNAVNGQLSYDADGNGAAGSIIFAIVDPFLSLTASDFVVV